MNKDPAFLFYTADFLVGVADLTMQERGQYITLMCLQHQHGHLSDKTICLSLGLTSVIEIQDVMAKFTKDESGFYYNERLDKEIEKRETYTESRRLNGMNGGRPKAEQKPYAEPYGLPHANHMPNHSVNDNDKEIGGAGGKKNSTKRRAKEADVDDGKAAYGSQKNVFLTLEEIARLKAEYPQHADQAIEFLSCYIVEKEYISKSHNLAIRRWVIDAVKKQTANGNIIQQQTAKVIKRDFSSIPTVARREEE
jgi:uncharacterized protein YdaU (DUF1376 family)